MIGRDDDQSLVAACRAGDKEAFGVLVRRYQDRLYPTLLRMTGRAEDALDLLQDAFFQAYRKLDQYHGQSAFYTWLYRLAVNLALSSRRRRREVTHGADREGHAPPEPVDESLPSDPSVSLERAERDQQIQNALSALASDHRAVIVMKDLDGLRYEEIAEALRIPVGTVRSRLHRARNELRERLRGIIEEVPVPEHRH